MVRSRIGAKAFVLCGLVAGLMAFAASGAQAEPTAFWGFKKTAASALEKFTKALEAKLAVAIEEKATLLFTTGGGTKVSILCTTAAFTEGGTLSAEGSILPGKLLFSGCDTLLNGVLSGACKPKAAGHVAGTILTEKDHGLIVLHVLGNGEKDHTVLLLPAVAGGRLAKIELGEECSIGAEVPVTGHLVLWDCKGNVSFLEHKVTHLIEEFPTLHKLVALGQTALLDGSANVSLTGEHSGYLWAGTPG